MTYSISVNDLSTATGLLSGTFDVQDDSTAYDVAEAMATVFPGMDVSVQRAGDPVTVYPAAP